jgi:hypothetical protein
VANKPDIVERPDTPAPQLPQPMGFASVEVVKSSQTELQPWNISADFIDEAFQFIKSLSVLNTKRSDQISPAKLAQLEKHTNTCAKMLKHRLSLFFRHRLPSQRLHLYYGQHWVWDSLAPFPKSACMTLMPAVHAPYFVNRQDSESLLGKGDKFKVVFDLGWKSVMNVTFTWITRDQRL